MYTNRTSVDGYLFCWLFIFVAFSIVHWRNRQAVKVAWLGDGENPGTMSSPNSWDPFTGGVHIPFNNKKRTVGITIMTVVEHLTRRIQHLNITNVHILAFV